MKPVGGKIKKTLLGTAMAVLLLGGLSACITVNVNRPSITASEKIINTNEVPNIFIEGDKATINVYDIYALNFLEGMRQINKLGIKHIHGKVSGSRW
jgi:hypothetical protein